MDVQEMREVAESVSEYYSCDCDPQIGVWSCPHCEARYLAKLMLVLTNPDPLTLDAAEAVMGREPDELRQQTGWVGMYWDNTDVIVAELRGEVGCEVHGTTVDNPPIGQFACLVAAAKMGRRYEQALLAGTSAVFDAIPC